MRGERVFEFTIMNFSYVVILSIVGMVLIGLLPNCEMLIYTIQFGTIGLLDCCRKVYRRKKPHSPYLLKGNAVCFLMMFIMCLC